MTTKKSLTRIGIVAVVAVVTLSVFGPGVMGAMQSEAVSVTQSPSSEEVTAGNTVEMTVELDVTGYNAPGLSATLPDGWSITSQSAEGPATHKSSTNEWVWLAGDVTQPYTVTYTIQVPEGTSPGEYGVSVEGSALDADQNRFTDTASSTITVVESGSDDDDGATDGDDGATDGDDGATDGDDGATDGDDGATDGDDGATDGDDGATDGDDGATDGDDGATDGDDGTVEGGNGKAKNA